jgi:nucleotide-binding universal stress UspA family protein
MALMKRILVPTDFSEPSKAAMDYAAKLGRSLGSQLTFLFVVEPVYLAVPGDMYAPIPRVDMLLMEQQRLAREQLAKLSRQLQKKGLKCRAVLATGSVYQNIADTARKTKADLIVIGTHGRTGLSHVLLGSVAERVVQTAPCPVLTVRSLKTGGRAKAKARRK